jgi:hypothetical protein
MAAMRSGIFVWGWLRRSYNETTGAFQNVFIDANSGSYIEVAFLSQVPEASSAVSCQARRYFPIMTFHPTSTYGCAGDYWL